MRWIALAPDEQGSPGVLREAVRSSRPATILRYGTEPAVAATFERLHGSSLLLRLEGETMFQDHEPLTIAFLSGERVAMFLTRIMDCPEPGRVRIALPGQCFAEMRRYPRVRVGPQSELVSHIKRGGQSWNPWVGDLSRGGALLCFEVSPPEFDLGSLIRLDLRMQQHAFSHTAMVVRRTHNSIGCRFQPMAEDSTPYIKLSTLLALLEREQAVA